MRVASVDIGTNSTRLLISDSSTDVVRRSVVTGLGRGVVNTGRLDPRGVDDTVRILAEFRSDLRRHGPDRVRVVTTAAARMATNTDAFLERAERALGVRPEVIDGDTEARLSYVGAISDLAAGSWAVVDIGGASTEITEAQEGVSIDIGSVRLTDRHFDHRPVRGPILDRARQECLDAMAGVEVSSSTLAGVAGTWTSLAAMDAKHGSHHPEVIHHRRLTSEAVNDWVERLGTLSVEATADLRGLDPARAPVILGGAVVAAAVLEHLRLDEVVISEHDLLDGVAAGLLGERFGSPEG